MLVELIQLIGRPGFVFVEEVERAGDDFGGFAAGCCLGSLLDFALDALFGGGIEGDGQGGSIRRGWGGLGGGFWREARGLHGVARFSRTVRSTRR
jgi:hypothetical protein